MRTLISLAVFAAASAAAAFNAEEWHGKRELLTREAERLMTAYTNCVAHLTTPADDVTVPLETFDDGSVKVIVHARKAQYFPENGLVWASGVVVKKFTGEGVLDARIDAENCVIDRLAKSGWADGPATIVHGKTVFRGRGVYFSSPEAYVKVFKDSVIESSDLKFGGIRP